MKFTHRNILLFVIITASLQLSGQVIKTKLDIVAGASAREYLHMGLRYQYTEITQLGFYYGGDLGFDKSVLTSYCIDNMIHFGKESYTSNRPVWYARQGFTLLKSIESDRKRSNYYLDFSLGHDFPVNDWLGFNIDLGMILQFREKYILDSGGDYYYDTNWYWMPLFRIQAYISL